MANITKNTNMMFPSAPHDSTPHRRSKPPGNHLLTLIA